MALKPIGIEDDGTFPGRVGTALNTLAQNANTTALNAKVDKISMVYLTQAEYDALATKDANVTYYITG